MPDHFPDFWRFLAGPNAVSSGAFRTTDTGRLLSSFAR